MAVPDYTTLAQIYEDINTRWADNNSRNITPEVLRDIVEGIVQYFGKYAMYKPEIIPIGGQSNVVIDLNIDRLQYYGQIPQVLVFLDDGGGQYYPTNVTWTLDQLPPDTTSITVDLGAPSEGVIILK